jgi:hypothetical protein
VTLTLVREASVEDHTYGVLYLGGVWFCHTLEDRVRPTKIPGQTAIPAGRYQVIISMSPRFKRPLPLLLAVPGFEGIRIHPGNTAEDTEGCILPGYARGQNSVLQSRAAFDGLFSHLQVARGQKFIDIINLESLRVTV